MMLPVSSGQRAKAQGSLARSQGKPLRWDDVPLFLALYRERSLARAAESLGLDTSTLSRRLAALEHSLRMKLFARSREGLEPTEHSERMLSAAEDVEAAMSTLRSTLSGAGREAKGIVRVSVPPGIAEGFVVPALAKLHREHPGIRVELDVSTSVADLTKREADLAVRTIRPRSPTLLQKKLRSSRWIPCATAKRVNEWGVIESFDAVPWIHWDDSLAHIAAARWLRRALGPAARIALVTSHFASQLAALDEGLGAALVPEPYLSLQCDRRPLATAPALDTLVRSLPVDDLWLVGHPAHRASAHVARVWSALDRALSH
jgi:DNA-binding transcriptional LysR family regulator